MDIFEGWGSTRLGLQSSGLQSNPTLAQDETSGQGIEFTLSLLLVVR